MKHCCLIISFFISNLVSASESLSVTVPDTMEERVKACTICHSNKDRVGRCLLYTSDAADE